MGHGSHCYIYVHSVGLALQTQIWVIGRFKRVASQDLKCYHFKTKRSVITVKFSNSSPNIKCNENKIEISQIYQHDLNGEVIGVLEQH